MSTSSGRGRALRAAEMRMFTFWAEGNDREVEGWPQAGSDGMRTSSSDVADMALGEGWQAGDDPEEAQSPGRSRHVRGGGAARGGV